MNVDGTWMWDGEVAVEDDPCMEVGVPTRVYLFEDTLDVEGIEYFCDGWSLFPREETWFYPVVSTMAAITSASSSERQMMYINNFGVENNVHLVCDPSGQEVQEHKELVASLSKSNKNLDLPEMPPPHHLTTDWHCRTFLSSIHQTRLRQSVFLRRNSEFIVKYGTMLKSVSTRWVASEPLVLMEVNYLGNATTPAKIQDAFARFDELANEYQGYYVVPGDESQRQSLKFLSSKEWKSEQYWQLLRKAFGLLKGEK